MNKDKMNLSSSRINKDYIDQKWIEISKKAMQEIMEKTQSTEQLKDYYNKIVIRTDFAPAWNGFIWCDTQFRYKIEELINKANLTFDDFNDDSKLFLTEINVGAYHGSNAVIKKGEVLGLFEKIPERL